MMELWQRGFGGMGQYFKMMAMLVIAQAELHQVVVIAVVVIVM